MRTVQMTLEDDLVVSIDTLAKKMKTTRSGITRLVLRDLLAATRSGQLEEKHRRGYQAKPVKDAEFTAWEKEQAWGDE